MHVELVQPENAPQSHTIQTLHVSDLFDRPNVEECGRYPPIGPGEQDIVAEMSSTSGVLYS